MKRLLSGIKPTGYLTIGNYIGAIKQFIERQDEYENFVFVADLHALTVYNDPDELRKKIRAIVGVYLACGLDPKKNTIFIQSENPYHAQLSWVLECNSTMGELSRMTQYKDRLGKGTNESISCGLFTYPVLMATDILLYDADIVPVGLDQKQHVELARNIAERFNYRYGDSFIVPEPVIPKHGEKIKDLQDPSKKMSKSDDNDKGCILLLDDPEDARKKIMSAVTDSETVVKYDEDNKPGISNLMTIYSELTNKTISEVEDEFKDQNYGTFKKQVAETVVNFLTDLQKKYKEVNESGLVDKVLDEGKEKSTKIASIKYEAIRRKVGVGR